MASIANSQWLSLAVYFTLLVGLLFFRSIPIQGRAIFLLRMFFPSWRFFDKPSERPLLYFRYGQNQQSLNPWRECLEKSYSNWSTLFLNAHGNHQLACASLVEQLENDLIDLDSTDPHENSPQARKLELSASYQLVKSLVAYQLSQSRSEQNSTHYQFKLSLISKDNHHDSLEDILISPVYELNR